MKKLIEQYEAAQEVASSYLNQIRQYEEEFLYLVQVDAYGSHNVTKHNNYYTAIMAAEMYNGDNGYATIYTTNLKHNFDGLRSNVVQRTISGLFEHAEKYKNHNLIYRLKQIQSNNEIHPS